MVAALFSVASLSGAEETTSSHVGDSSSRSMGSVAHTWQRAEGTGASVAAIDAFDGKLARQRRRSARIKAMSGIASPRDRPVAVTPVVGRAKRGTRRGKRVTWGRHSIHETHSVADYDRSSYPDPYGDEVDEHDNPRVPCTRLRLRPLGITLLVAYASLMILSVMPV